MLKLFKLWTFIAVQKTVPLNFNSLKIWTIGRDETCIILCLVVKGNTYIDIKNYTNAFKVLYLLEVNFKPLGLGFLNGIIEKLLLFILSNCKNEANYITRFCFIITNPKAFL